MNPLRSQYRALIRSRRFEVNKNSAPENGFSFSTSWTNAASPLRCFLMSIGARCRYTRSIRGSGRSMIASLHQRRHPRCLRQIHALDHPAARMPQPTHRPRAVRRHRGDAHCHESIRGLQRLRNDLDRSMAYISLARQLRTDTVQTLRPQALGSAVACNRSSLYKSTT